MDSDHLLWSKRSLNLGTYLVPSIISYTDISTIISTSMCTRTLTRTCKHKHSAGGPELRKPVRPTTHAPLTRRPS
ncbi:hypothetical protein J6590_035938 [Homalodisca vitripennis]|nr:hypothetical protein J6590_035938 [Homalodisca vitripennis]